MNLPRSKFRRFLVGHPSEEELRILEIALQRAGRKVYIENGRIKSRDHTALLVRTTLSVNWIITGEDARLDREIDLALKAIVERSDALRCRCSDCYAHFTGDRRLADVRESESCEASQRKHPVKIHRGRRTVSMDTLLPVDPLDVSLDDLEGPSDHELLAIEEEGVPLVRFP